MNPLYQAHNYHAAGKAVISIRCPWCRRQGVLEPMAEDVRLAHPPHTYFCHRRCPNPACHGYIFVVLDHQQLPVDAFPPESIDFDSTGLPATVLATITEAIQCHANGCYVAAAIMIRKTLELLCEDRGATGANLKERIRQLRSRVVMPTELLDGLDHLRLLGNDAAHVNSLTYANVGREEVEVGIDVTKEVLKSMYQYNAIVDRLKKLQTPKP